MQIVDEHLDLGAEQGVPSLDVSSLSSAANTHTDQPVLALFSWESEIAIAEELFDSSQKSDHSSTHCASPSAPTLVRSLDMENHYLDYLPAGSKRSFSQSDES